MADNVPDPGDLEGEPYGEIEFMVEKHQNAARASHKLDCNLVTPLIGGLKEDFADRFDVSAEKQKWYLGEKLLDDQKTLWNSGITCQVDVTKIKVICY